MVRTTARFVHAVVDIVQVERSSSSSAVFDTAIANNWQRRGASAVQLECSRHGFDPISSFPLYELRRAPTRLRLKGGDNEGGGGGVELDPGTLEFSTYFGLAGALGHLHCWRSRRAF